MKANCISNLLDRVGNSYFHGEFNKTKIPQKYKSLGRIKKDRSISRKDYDKIVAKYFDVYYNEVYFLGKPSYFFLGGFLQLVRTSPGVKRIGRTEKKIYSEQPLFLKWFGMFEKARRNDIKYFKLKGSTSKTAALEEKWKKSNNYLKLKTYNDD